jgi:hypothetical protein
MSAAQIRVSRMQHNSPDFAALHPGYSWFWPGKEPAYAVSRNDESVEA